MPQNSKQLIGKSKPPLGQRCVYLLICLGLLSALPMVTYSAIFSYSLLDVFSLAMIGICVPVLLAHASRDTVSEGFSNSYNLLLDLGLSIDVSIEKLWKNLSDGMSLLQFFFCEVLSLFVASRYVHIPLVAKLTVTSSLSNRQ
jgi:hypothetical protein